MSKIHNVSEEELGALKRKGRQTSFTCDAHDTITEASALECPVEGCSSRASKDSNLRRHLQQKHGYAHSCSECEEVFRMYRELKDHIAETHPVTRVIAPSSRRYNVKCSGPGCTESFISREKLAEHCRDVHDPSQFRIHRLTFKDDATFTVFFYYPESKFTVLFRSGKER